MEQEELKQKIRKYRKQLDITQEELAKKADIPYATLVKIENGHVTNPTIQTLIKIANALGVGVEDLIKQ